MIVKSYSYGSTTAKAGVRISGKYELHSMSKCQEIIYPFGQPKGKDISTQLQIPF